MAVLGVGTVELLTIHESNGSGKVSHGVLELTNALHVPNTKCNLLGGDSWDGFTICMYKEPSRPAGMIDLHRKKVVSFYQNHPMYVVKLQGPPKGFKFRQTAFTKTESLCGVTWLDSERGRWTEFQMEKNRQLYGSCQPAATLPCITSSSEVVVRKSPHSIEDPSAPEPLKKSSKRIASTNPSSDVIGSAPEPSKKSNKRARGADPSINQILPNLATTRDRPTLQTSEKLSKPTDSQPSPFTEAELSYLKIHFDTEHKLLTHYGLSLYKEEDRDKVSEILSGLVELVGNKDELHAEK